MVNFIMLVCLVHSKFFCLPALYHGWSLMTSQFAVCMIGQWWQPVDSVIWTFYCVQKFNGIVVVGSVGACTVLVQFSFWHNEISVHGFCRTNERMNECVWLWVAGWWAWTCVWACLSANVMAQRLRHTYCHFKLPPCWGQGECNKELSQWIA